jgi:amidase
MARTAEDVALMLQAIAGPSPLAPLRQPMEGREFVTAVRNGPARNLRVAYCPDIAGIGVDPGIEMVCRRAAHRLAECGTSVEEIILDLSAGRDAFLTLRGLWFVAWMQERLDRLDELGVNVRNNTRAGLAGLVPDIAKAEVTRGTLWHTFRSFFERYDHLLTPTMAVPPFPVERNYPDRVAGKEMKTYVDWIAPTFVLSLTGLPVASVPCGLDAEGMPVGMQIVGRPQAEEAVLALAKVMQDQSSIGGPRLEGNPG